MEIARDSVVSFHYRLANGDGEALESSHDGAPRTYLHGHGNIIPGLEQEMAGKSAGAHFTTTIAPALAYGERREAAVARVQMKQVRTRGRLHPGQTIAVETAHGLRQVKVIKAGHSVVDVDANHPLAGVTLTFEIDIVEVRAATAEELAHGHVHGPGGHHH
jgi:FKBP-type peptidyl-prolyl cis-trans isomerase SlyD